jgi:hypothetical protein
MLKMVVFGIALAMLAWGMFWQDVQVYTNDWFSSLNTLFFSK